MLILKLNLPEEKIYYSKLGTRVSTPVPHTPERIKGTQLELEVSGYVAEDDFFAFGLYSPDRVFTTKEQFTLLTNLGFKLVPIEYYPQVEGTVDVLIRKKNRYAQYGAYWLDMTTGEEYKLPELATIESSIWTLDAKYRLVRQLTTDKGVYDVIDHRTPEYYQVGLQVKISNGEVYPYMTGRIIDPVPDRCPKCNNPLKKFQLASDLPLILKCTAPLCRLLEWVPDGETLPPEEPVEDSSFRNEDNTEIISDELIESSEVAESGDSADSPKRFKVVNLECDIPENLEQVLDVVTTTDDLTDVDYIVTKSRHSVTKRSRSLAKETEIPLITLSELEERING